ncbi:peptidylprolyl isomerase [Tsuneonella sp. YG55]|uniref:Peptidylprolyl isomerase n=1 Tax=Tsuneonella litorea TaxID=2976475 RepID=A0A9X3AJU2_9SPHN|nr:peptidylprolyl isomerase [Tsuneonella litorea]MCT2557479.1 peptidylprolyl isomerase [Tsuneonella litorea]
MSRRGWLRERALHLVLLGAVIFGVLGWRSGSDDLPGRTIHLTRDDQARLAAGFAEVMGRPPTPAERDALIADWVRDEVLYREALRRGLDEGDVIIRKRLAQKMDAIAARDLDAESPGDATLQRWLEAHPERFAEDAAVTFDQAYFTTRSRAQVARTLIEGGADWQRVGDAISLPAHFERAGRDTVAAALGEQFARTLDGLQTGAEWQGPVEGALGWHLVRLTAREPGRLPPLAAIRERVEGDWRDATGRAQTDAAYEALRDAYTVTIDE